MANLIKRNNGGALETWDPIRTMREMLRWDPFREMAPVAASPVAYVPKFDVTETKDSYRFHADIPGVKKEDIEIQLAGNRLTISGKREMEKETKEETYYAYERDFGTFTRAFTLPDGIDSEHATSELKEGVLTLVIPKLAKAQAKKIEVKTVGVKS